MTARLKARDLSRLVLGERPGAGPGLDAHVGRHGRLPLPSVPSPQWGQALVGEIERSGLTGRGGAGFPSAQKLVLAGAQARPTLVVNAMEGEPASAKDRFLVATAPHLVLDGADLVASALGAARTVVCVAHDAAGSYQALVQAVGERAAGYARARLTEVRRLPGRYVAGEESALAAAVGGGAGVPTFRPDKSVPLALGRAAALVHNVETLAHVALIARHGAGWFREVGAPEAPGTCLVTVSGGVGRPGVVEVATGTPVAEIVDLARPLAPVQAVLAGGYGGSWLAGEGVGASYCPSGLRPFGASMGAGILVALPAGSCPIRETERIARFLAGESAGQCGPCLFGLPAIAQDLGVIADGSAGPEVLDRLLRRAAAVAGRGACRHPDGAVRLVRSAVAAFPADFASHVAGRPCPGSRRPSILTGFSG